MKRVAVVLSLAALAACTQPGDTQPGETQACRESAPVAAARDRVRDVVEKRVALGMTTCEVLAVWGMPDDVSESNLFREARTMYVYRNRPGSPGAVVRFSNGRVESIQ
jgi:hypothetical protein